MASFPFDDHNCPPIQLIISFCQSAYAWLKEDIENVVVVHCKAGMARTGLMISSLLLYLKVSYSNYDIERYLIEFEENFGDCLVPISMTHFWTCILFVISSFQLLRSAWTSTTKRDVWTERGLFYQVKL